MFPNIQTCNAEAPPEQSAPAGTMMNNETAQELFWTRCVVLTVVGLWNGVLCTVNMEQQIQRINTLRLVR